MAYPVILLTSLTAMLSPLPRTGESTFEAATPWEMVDLDLDVVLEPDMRRLTGRSILRVQRTPGASEELVLEIGEGMRIVGIEVPLPADRVIDSTGTVATISFPVPPRPGDELEIMVSFASEGRGFQMVVDPKGALASWARTWYPIPRDGSYAAPGLTRLTLPVSWRALANGGLNDRRESEDTAVETWSSALPVARSFAAGPYHAVSRRVGDRTVGIYLLEHATRAEEFLAALAEILDSLEKRFGPYPYPGYALAEIPEGLVEWTGSSEQGFFMAASSALDGPINVPLFAHELAHGWWGNRVRAVMPGALMVGEALAQYGAVLAIEAIEGADAAVEFLRFSREGYNPIQSAKGFWSLRIAGQDRALAQLRGEGQDHNLADAKGHWFYQMLRRRTGDRKFFSTLRSLLEEHDGGTLSLPELRAAFVASADPEADVETFLDQWLDRPGAPVLDVRWSDASRDSGFAADVVIRQLTPSPYRLRLEIAVESEVGIRRHEVELNEATTRATLESDGPPTRIVADPDHDLLIWDAAYCPG